LLALDDFKLAASSGGQVLPVAYAMGRTSRRLGDAVALRRDDT